MKLINSFFLIFSIAILFSSCNDSKPISQEDWACYKYDNYRSGSSPTNIDLSNFDEDWVFTSSDYPVPAWYGPANEDAFANSGPLPSMRDYDLAFYPIIVGDHLYFGSTADDGLHCIDSKSGKEIWNFTTNGPIHNAPVYDSGKLYFGSDDGYVYCINAKNAKLIWSFSPSPKDAPLVLNNGRLISFWPIRTGVTVDHDKVFFGASLLPWKKSYLCAIDKQTGKADGDECYVREFENNTFEGAMALTNDKILQPQGRIAPAFFDKLTGESAGMLPGAGGCYVLVTKEENIVHSKTPRNKTMQELSKSENPDFMTFNGGKEILVKGDTSFVLTDNSISAYERSTSKLIWLRRDFKAHRIIIAGDYLFAGATDKVFGLSRRNGLPLWEASVKGTVYALAAANEALYASTGEGHIYCFKSGGNENELFAINKDSKPTIDPVKELELADKPLIEPDLYAGPFIETVAKDTVKLSFTTNELANCKISWFSDAGETIIQESKGEKNHMYLLPVRKDFRYTAELSINGNDAFEYEFDNFFNFTKKRKHLPLSATLPLESTSQVSNALEGPKMGTGLCIILGSKDINIPYLIANNSRHDIVILDKSVSKINKLRETLKENYLYGRSISAYSLNELSLNRINPDIASLVWVEDPNDYNPDEIIRLIAPGGKALIKKLDEDNNWLKDSELGWQVTTEYEHNSLIINKLKLENQGEWTHQYARPDNSAFGGESLWGSTSTEEFEIQWMGRPGPRFQTDRSGRKPSPLAVSGKLFVQGKERIACLDVYNGAIYWSRDYAGFIRMNIHRDCSNWAADQSNIYTAINNKLITTNQSTGEISNIRSVENPEKYEWGYVAVLDNSIIGSTTPKGSHYTNYHGGEGWYDWAEGPMAEKVVSKSIFSISKSSYDLEWDYSVKGAIINSTISIDGNMLYFAESRTPGLKLSEIGRGQDDIFKSVYLVCLNHLSGEKVWERKLDTHPGKTTYFMAAGNGKLVILSSADSEYFVYTYDSQNGDLVWTDKMPWFHSNHGGHLSRPAIAGNRLVIKPAIYQLENGERISYNVPKSGHGCASYALTEQSVFYRGGSVTQFNFDTREFSRWERLRPDCWISTIPAQGMILSPEAGGGCSCGNWLETSMVMAPLSRAPLTIERNGTEHLIDYMDETYGDYTQSYLPNEFASEIEVNIRIKPGIQGEVYYTTDGSKPTENSNKYSTAFKVDKTTEVKAMVLVNNDKPRKYFRSKQFTKKEEALEE